MKVRRCFAAAFACMGMLVPCIAQNAQSHAYALTGDYWATHDPSIGKDGNTYYVFATGKAPSGGQMAIRCSNDLRDWKLCGQVFDHIPAWIHKESPGTAELWAPDVSYYHGRYQLYYAYSLFGKNTSGIALVTNKTLDPKSPNYHWDDQGLVLQSTEKDNYNAIDPNFIMDAHGQPWLAFGSFWGGIQLTKLDPKTGKPPAGQNHVTTIAARKKTPDAAPAKPGLPPDWQAVEAPFIVHHGQYYYLFVSWDLCCRGTKSTYHTMVGRAHEITGPYLDKNGVSMADGGGTEVLSADAKWLGPGGESALTQPSGDLLVFHAYDAKTGKPALQISTIGWAGGWPQVALQQ